MIKASVTKQVPWGFVCGYPTSNGDCYGGAHYSQSSAASLTLQGKAIQQAAIDFGDGKTLPFTPCKKGYIPNIGKRQAYACPLHNKARKKRLEKEQGRFRPGEIDLEIIFWSKLEAKEENKKNPSKDVYPE
jgi:hypothetical protein